MKRLRIFSIVTAVFFLSILAIAIFRTREPRYQGRTLTQWVDYYMRLESNDLPDARTEVAMSKCKDAIREIGTDGIPAFLKWMQATDSVTKAKLNSILDRQSFIQFRFPDAEHCHWRGFTGFKILRKDAVSAVPALTKLLESPDRQQREFALQSIYAIGHDGRHLSPVIAQSLQNSHADIRRLAAAYLIETDQVEAEKAGVYKMFPEFGKIFSNHRGTNQVAR